MVNFITTRSNKSNMEKGGKLGIFCVIKKASLRIFTGMIMQI
jgi:hypothetical protein